MTAQGLSVIPTLSRLSPLVTRILGCNPGPMTLQGSNTYLVGSGKSRILIDSGDGAQPEYFQHLKNALDEANVTLGSVVITHWHGDHTGGVEKILKDFQVPNKAVYKFRRNDDTNPDVYTYIQDGHEFQVEGANLKCIHTPGHTTDHVILHLQEENAIFSGDCMLGEGTAVFEDLYDYMRSLQTILALKPSVIYPGHGKVIDDPIDKIEYYISHRNQRERQILECLTANASEGDGMTALDIVKIVYKDTPTNLHPAAAFNVSHHLKKMEKEGLIDHNEETDSYWVISKESRL